MEEPGPPRRASAKSAHNSCDDSERCSSGDTEKSEPPVPEDAFLHGGELTILVITLMLAQFIMGLDATVISVALPKVTDDFHSLDDVGWIYVYFNIKITFILAVLLFELGSILCAIAPNSPMLIFGRAVAGLGQAAVVAGGVMLITRRVPVSRRALYLAILQSINGVASVLGPLLGGLFTDSERLTWRFCFWINLPFGAILVASTVKFIRNPQQEHINLPLAEKIRQLDLVGASVFITSWTFLFLGLQNGSFQGGWSRATSWGWFVGFGICMIAFLVLQKRLGDAATIPLRVFSDRTVVFGCVYTFSIAVGNSTFNYFLPFYFQSSRGVSALQSGLYMIPFLVSISVSCVTVGALLVLVGTLSPFMMFGAVAFTIAAGLLTTLRTDSPIGLPIGLQVPLGLGYGSTLQIALVAIQVAIGQEMVATGNGLFFISNFGGGALGMSFSDAIFQSVLTQQLVESVPQLNTAEIMAAGATAIVSVVPSSLVPLVRQAYATAVTQSFLLPTAMASLSCICVFGMRWIDLKK